MLLSIALIILTGYMLGKIFELLKLPSLIGMLLAGIILGPQVLNLIEPGMISISGDIRQIALVVILSRAGLTLNLEDLKEIGKPAILMAFIPGLFEIAAVTIFAPLIFDITILEAAIMGCILAPVSAAVTIPKMISLMDSNLGKEKKIPHLIMAGTSIDDVFIVVLYASLIDLYLKNSFSIVSFLTIPISIVIGLVIGFIIGKLLITIYNKVKMNTSIQIGIYLAISLLLVYLETKISFINISSLLSVIVIGVVILHSDKTIAKKMSVGFNHIWDIASIFLFVLVGVVVQFNYVSETGIFNILLILLLGSLFRFIGVFISLIKTNLTLKERLFCGIAYIPKATVQAAMGALPLALGLPSGEIILAVSVVAILILAPLGAFLIDYFDSRLLTLNNTLESNEFKE